MGKKKKKFIVKSSNAIIMMFCHCHIHNNNNNNHTEYGVCGVKCQGPLLFQYTSVYVCIVNVQFTFEINTVFSWDSSSSHQLGSMKCIMIMMIRFIYMVIFPLNSVYLVVSINNGKKVNKQHINTQKQWREMADGCHIDPNQIKYKILLNLS